MNKEEQIKDIIEILELSKEEIENNNENITATLDLQDLKSLKSLYDLYIKERDLNNELQIRYKIENDKYQTEKEKNKALKEGLKYRINYCELLEKELYANGVNYEFEKTEIEKQFLEE